MSTVVAGAVVAGAVVAGAVAAASGAGGVSVVLSVLSLILLLL